MNAHAEDALVLQLKDDTFNPDSIAWHQESDQLISALQRRQVTIKLDQTPIAGTRGSAAEFVLALGSAGAIAAAVEVLRTWLDGRKSRRIHLKRRTKDRSAEKTLEITADELSVEAIKALLDDSES